MCLVGERTLRIQCLLVGLAVACGLAAISPVRSAAATPAPHQRLVSEYCVACHSSDAKIADLDLETASSRPLTDSTAIWERVVRKLRARQMPPLGSPHPEEAAYTEVLASLTNELDAHAEKAPDPGRTDTFRRLTRREYQNAVRDLLALELDLSSVLPPDQSSSGFDNITVGDLSPALLESYVAAADKISRLAIGRPIDVLAVETVKRKPDVTQEWHVDGLPIGTRGGMAFQHTFPLDAEYEIRIRLARDRDEQIEGLRVPHQVELLLDRERIRLFEVVPPRHIGDHSNIDKHLKIRLRVKAGPHEVGVTFLKKPWAVLETDRQPYQAHFNVYRHPRVQPAVYQVSILGPFDATGPGKTPSRERVFVCRPAVPADEDACARRILAHLMRRAYRREVAEEDFESPLDFYRRGKAADGFEAGIEMALSSILVSPEFLFRVEREPPGIGSDSVYTVSDAELASRLSFFLWSSIPDEELLETALRGELSRPEVLEQQVRRMLRDERSEALVSNFAAQWLHLRNLDSAKPDMRLFPGFDDNLRQAFRRETELLLQSVMQGDRSLLDLLSTDYTFLNERLAKHYRVPHVYGSWFRKVDLDETSRRGGLLRHGSILTVTSYNTRTSPVIRGHWVLENLLGVPPPPPPPNVSTFDQEVIDSSLSMRDRLEAHRANPACSGCHSLMDPLGFALENYDAVGRWRESEGTEPIDAAGNFPGGSEFRGVAGLEQALLERPELFVGTFVEKLMTYALGRVVEHYDAPAVRKILREARPDGFRFSQLVLGIAKSKPFQMRRST